MRASMGVTSVGLVIILSLCLGACGGGKGTGAGTGGTPTVTSVAITPTNVNVGQQQQLVATATYSDGSTGAVTPQTWSSLNTQALTVSSSGIATGIASGQSTITASYSGVVGQAVIQVHGGALSVTITGTITGTVTITGAGGYTANVVANQTLQVAPGSYTITGNQVTSGTSTYWPSVQTQSVTIPDGGSASATVNYSTIIPNTTKVLDAAGINSLVVSAGGSTITISSSSAVAASLNVGDVLAIAPSVPAPTGLLLRILAVSTTGATVTASVQPAALADAIQQATVNFTQVIGPQTLTAKSRKMLAIRRSILATAADATGACAGAANTLQLPYSVPLVQASSGGVSGDLTLSGEDDLCATLQLDFQIGFFTLQSLDATLQSGLHTSINLSDTVQGSVSGSQDLPTLQGSTITLLIGNVPIGVTPSLTPFVGASGSAKATVSTGVTTDTSLTLGVSYASGIWTPTDTTLSPTTAAGTTSAGANVTLKGLAGLRAGLSIDSVPIPVVGANVNLAGDGYLQLTAGSNNNPCWTLDGGLEANAGIAATVFDKTVAAYTTPTLSLYTANIAQANGPCYTVTVTPPSSMLDVGATVQETATEVDLLGNPVSAQFDWTSSDASIATVDQNGLVTSVSAGTATITATDATTTAFGTATINSNNAAPTYFLTGNWSGTATAVVDGMTSTSDVGASITQNATSFSATLSVLAAGNVPITYTVNGQINGNNISYTIASSGDSEVNGGDVTGTIGSNGLQVIGSGLDGSSGTMTWDGQNTLTGSVILADGTTGTGTVTTNGQTLTGMASISGGDSVSWTLTLQ